MHPGVSIWLGVSLLQSLAEGSAGSGSSHADRRRRQRYDVYYDPAVLSLSSQQAWGGERKNATLFLLLSITVMGAVLYLAANPRPGWTKIQILWRLKLLLPFVCLEFSFTSPLP